MNCVAFKIKGHVQGVFYRVAVEKKATELGLKGFTRNEPDGSVLVVACGDSDELIALEEWLWIGSPSSDVSGVTQSPSSLGPFDDFRVLR